MRCTRMWYEVNDLRRSALWLYIIAGSLLWLEICQVWKSFDPRLCLKLSLKVEFTEYWRTLLILNRFVQRSACITDLSQVNQGAEVSCFTGRIFAPELFWSCSFILNHHEFKPKHPSSSCKSNPARKKIFKWSPFRFRRNRRSGCQRWAEGARARRGSSQGEPNGEDYALVVRLHSKLAWKMG